MFPLCNSDHSNKQYRQFLERRHASQQLQTFTAIFETIKVFFLVFLPSNCFPIKLTDKIHLPASNAEATPLQQIARSTPLAQRWQTLLPWQNAAKRNFPLGRRNKFSVTDKQITVLSWKLTVRLFCLPKKMDSRWTSNEPDLMQTHPQQVYNRQGMLKNNGRQSSQLKRSTNTLKQVELHQQTDSVICTHKKNIIGGKKEAHLCGFRAWRS